MSKLIETRLEFQELAGHRLDEAKALLDAEKWDGAYYLAGYAVELALKSCIIKRYHRIEQKEAETLYSAIADNTPGVFTWIKRHW